MIQFLSGVFCFYCCVQRSVALKVRVEDRDADSSELVDYFIAELSQQVAADSREDARPIGISLTGQRSALKSR